MIAGLSEKDILKRGSWKRSSTWQRFYRKEFNKDVKNAQIFQQKLFERKAL